MQKTKEFQGKLVINLTDGKKLGEVNDIYLQKEAKKLVAAFFGKSGITNPGNSNAPMLAAPDQAEKMKIEA